MGSIGSPSVILSDAENAGKLDISNTLTEEANAIIAESNQLNKNRAYATRTIESETVKRLKANEASAGSPKNPFCDIPKNLGPQYKIFTDNVKSEKVKVFDIKEASMLGSKNGITSPLIVSVALPAKDKVLMREDFLCGMKNGKFVMLSLADDKTVGNNQYEESFLNSAKSLNPMSQRYKGKDNMKVPPNQDFLSDYGNKVFEYDVNQDVTFEDGKLKVLEHTLGKKDVFKNRVGKVVESGNGKIRADRTTINASSLIRTTKDEKRANITKEALDIPDKSCKGDKCEIESTSISKPNLEYKEIPESQRLIEDNKIEKPEQYLTNFLNRDKIKSQNKTGNGETQISTSYKTATEYAKKHGGKVIILKMQEKCEDCDKLKIQLENNRNERDGIVVADGKTDTEPPFKFTNENNDKWYEATRTPSMFVANANTGMLEIADSIDTTIGGVTTKQPLLHNSNYKEIERLFKENPKKDTS